MLRLKGRQYITCNRDGCSHTFEVKLTQGETLGQVMKLWGWMPHPLTGWQCPTCYKKYKENDDG